MVPADKAVGRKQCVRPDDAGVAGRDVERPDVLMLCLRDLIVGVGHVESGSRGLNIQVNGVVRAGPEIESVEERDLIARVVKRLELGWIEKAIRPQSRQ